MNLGNFRDLGGIKTTCGRTVAPRRLLRSAQPVGLTDEARTMLAEHGLKSIIDFRTIFETQKDPVDIIDGVDYKHIDIMGANNAQAANPNYWTELMSEDISKVEEEFIRTYVEFAISEPSRKGYGDFVRACIALKDGAVLFHCAAGKDRTGLAAAIILKLLGVSDADIFDDYLKTAEYQAKLAAKYTANAKAQGVSDKQLAAMQVLFGVKPGYLKAALDAAENKVGSFEAYAEKGLGLTPDCILELNNLYLS